MVSSKITTVDPEILDPPTSRTMAVAVALLVLSVFINYVDRGNLSIAAPLLKVELGISAFRLGILLSAFVCSYSVFLFLSGWLVDRFDVNRVLAFGYLLWSLATAATGLVRGFAMLLTMRLILGLGESVAFPSYAKILARHLPEHDRGFANGAIAAGMKVGPAVGTLGAGVLMVHYGWRPVFLGIGLVSLIWLPAWMKWMPRGGLSTPFLLGSPRVIDILQKRPFWAQAAGNFCFASPLYCMLLWLPFYLVHERGLSMQSMVNKTALYFTVGATAALVTGAVTDFCIRRGLAVGLVRKSAMVTGWTIVSLAFLGCSSAGPHSYLAWLLTAALGGGIGESGVWAITQTLAGQQAVGRWAGLQNGLVNLSGVVWPTLTGFTVDRTGHFQLAIGITAGVCLFGVLVWIFLIGELKQVNWGTVGGRSPAAADGS